MGDFKIGGLAGEEAGEGVPVVLLHGLTATRRYVVMGSKNLERGGHRVVMYDARGHGRSDPADAYGYDELADDLLAVLDDRGIDRAVLAGASMGAHTLVRLRAASIRSAPRRWWSSRRPSTRTARAGLRALGRAVARAARGWGGGLPRGLRRAARAGVVPRHGQDGAAPAAVGARAPRGGGRRARARCRARGRSSRGTTSRGSICRSSWWRAATRPTPSTRTRSASATRRRSRARGCVSEEPGKSPLAWQGGQLSRVIAETAAQSSRRARRAARSSADGARSSSASVRSSSARAVRSRRPPRSRQACHASRYTNAGASRHRRRRPRPARAAAGQQARGAGRLLPAGRQARARRGAARLPAARARRGAGRRGRGRRAVRARCRRRPRSRASRCG